MLSFEEIVFINKAKVMIKVTHDLSPIYITEMFQIKESNNETMTLISDYIKNLSHPMGKPTICIGENKGADQLRGYRSASR